MNTKQRFAAPASLGAPLRFLGRVFGVLAALQVGAGAAVPELSFGPAHRPDTVPLHRQLSTLPMQAQVRLTDIPLGRPGEPTANLNLERFPVFAGDARVIVRDEAGETEFPVPETAHFRGVVEGFPGSKAFVSVAADGSIRSILHLGPDLVVAERGGPGTPGEVATGRRVNPQHDFAQRSFTCGADPRQGRVSGASPAAASLFKSAQGMPAPEASSAPPTAELTSTYYDATIAFETDVEFLQRFSNSQSAATQYIADLLGYVSSVYNTEVKVNLKVGNIYLYTTATYPWNAATSTKNALDSLKDYWTSNRSGVSRAAAHLLSGQSLGGGIAYLGALCDTSYGYGVSAGISGQFNASNPQIVWDAVVVAHELGHNFGSPHTHGYDNKEGVASPVDCCYSDTGNTGMCATQSGLYPGPGSLSGGTSGTGAGTIMSYCHTLAGGLGNLSFTFGQSHTIGVSPGRVPIVMRKEIEATVLAVPSCLPTTNPPTAPAAPTIGTATAGNAQVIVSFAAPTENGGQPITGYTATCTPTGGGSGVSANGAASPIAVTGLTNGTSYTCRVVATNSVGTSLASSASNSVTPSLAAVTAGQLTTSFAGTSYLTGGGNMFNITPLAGNLSITRFDLNLMATAGTVVPVNVYTKSGGFSGSESNSSAWTLRGTVNVTSAGSGSPSAMPVTPIVLTSGPTYGVYIAPTDGSAMRYTNNSGQSSTSADSNIRLDLGAAVVYPFAGLVSGARIWNGTVYYEISAAVPQSPTGVSAIAGNGQAAISFTAPSNNGGASITGYTASCTPSGGSAVTASGSASPIVVTGLSNGTAYSCSVVATNGVGNSSPSSAVSVTPSTRVNGTCGSAHGVAVIATPTSNLCALGSASAVSGSGPWTWTCAGSGGGSSANCAAPLSIVDHYYLNILNRGADAGGRNYWLSEVTRMNGLGADPKETYIAMARYFFTSAEFTGRNLDDDGFVRNLYLTFFNRAADQGGLDFWKGQITLGLSRDMVMYAFMFSGEFNNFMTQNAGAGNQRAEIGAVIDYYRGAFGRLPDDGGLKYWVNRFRTAQCSSNATGDVYTAAIDIAGGFFGGQDYWANPASITNTKYVSDLYNAFMRRSADLNGFNYWVSALAANNPGHTQMRKSFIDTAEFAARVQAITSQGCTTLMQ